MLAKTWADAVLGKSFNWLLPASVALSTFGTATGNIYSAGRYAVLFYDFLPTIR
jgi:hypothetical protein